MNYLFDFFSLPSMVGTPAMPRQKPPGAKLNGGNNSGPSRADEGAGALGGRKSGSPAAAPDWLKEELLRKEKDDPAQVRVPLKNGAGQIKIGEARLAQEQLRWLLQDEPKLFTALRSIIEGRGDEVSGEDRHALSTRLLLTRSGEAKSGLRAVMTAGCRDTPVGPIIEEPLDLTNPEHAAIAQQEDQNREEVLNRSHAGELRLRLAILEAKKKFSKGESKSR